MFTVIVVDDEPAAVNHICKIIELKCPQFQVVETAENAKEGLEKIRIHKPDLVITDIKMPNMNGIDFVKMVKEEFPFIYSIIVSGYQDFEYAKGAIQLGALDYILKPVNPTLLKNILDQLTDKLKITLYQNRNLLIRSMSRGVIQNDTEIKRYFPGEKYYAAIIRRNGLPRRFSSKSDIEIFSGEGEMMYLYGRDEMEALYICPEELIFSKNFAELITKISNKETDIPGFTTSVIITKSFNTDKLYEMIKTLYKTLDSRLVIGYTQVIELEGDMIEEQNRDCNKMNMLMYIEHLNKDHNWHIFKSEFTRLMIRWKEERRPMLWIERKVRLIFYYMQIEESNIYGEDNEYMLVDAFFYATSMEELIDSLLYILDKNKHEESKCFYKVDTQEFMEKVKNYLNLHISEQITLQSVCKKFGVSQTYLSKLFRKYVDDSFNNYLTTLRIEFAKRLMSENKKFLVKDVASMVGYSDQFYFSRVFCSVTGTPPSVYADSL